MDSSSRRDGRQQASAGSLRARTQQGRRGGPRLGAHGVGTTSAGDHPRLVRTRGRRRGCRSSASAAYAAASAVSSAAAIRRLFACPRPPRPASGAGDAAATVAAPPDKPANASITARSAGNHRDRPRPTSSAAARRHLLDSSVGSGSRGTGSPVNVDQPKVSPASRGHDYGPKGRDDVDSCSGILPFVFVTHSTRREPAKLAASPGDLGSSHASVVDDPAPHQRSMHRRPARRHGSIPSRRNCERIVRGPHVGCSRRFCPRGGRRATRVRAPPQRKASRPCQRGCSRVVKVAEPVSPSYRNRVREPSCTYRSQRVAHLPELHTSPLETVRRTVRSRPVRERAGLERPALTCGFFSSGGRI